MYQGVPDSTTADAEFFSVASWKSYLFGDGPSPIQNVVSGSSSVTRLYQILQFDDDVARTSGRIWNVIDASPFCVVGIEAELEGRSTPNQLDFRFTGGRVLLNAIWEGKVALPYPVPFKLLGDEACGYLRQDYLSPTMRLTRGNKGTRFVFTPEDEPDNPDLMSLLRPSEEEGGGGEKEEGEGTGGRDPVLVCPAQFGTEADYADLVSQLTSRGHSTTVAPLKFTDWLRLLPSTFTKDYWQGELKPENALQFYFEALDKAVEGIKKESGEGRKIQLVGHSLGG